MHNATGLLREILHQEIRGKTWLMDGISSNNQEISFMEQQKNQLSIHLDTATLQFNNRRDCQRPDALDKFLEYRNRVRKSIHKCEKTIMHLRKLGKAIFREILSCSRKICRLSNLLVKLRSCNDMPDVSEEWLLADYALTLKNSIQKTESFTACAAIIPC